MKPLVELPIDHYESLLKYAAEASPLYSRLKNAVKTEANTVAILCEIDEAEMLRDVAKHFCRGAVPEIERALKVALAPDRGKPKTFLREHPLLTHRGVHSWPPAWVWTDGGEKRPKRRSWNFTGGVTFQYSTC